LFNIEASLVSPELITIIFENKDTSKSSGSTDGTWLTHPAFTFGTKDVNGIWVGKFETSTDNITCNSDPRATKCMNVDPLIIPNVPSLRFQNTSTQFLTSQKFNNEEKYGLTSDFDSHMMKNMEWGSVAYLSHSIYGKYGNSMYTGANKEIYQNKSNAYITGSSNGTIGSIQYSPSQCAYDDIADRDGGAGACGGGASTTGNIYGIYDMSGGSHEGVMGGMYSSGDEYVNVSSSGFVQSTIDSANMVKYINKYKYGTSLSDYSRGQIGDATGETRRWYGDYDLFVFSSYSWFIRGNYFGVSTGSGVFDYDYNHGGADSRYSFRVVQLKP
jgi:hypothetical protein